MPNVSNSTATHARFTAPSTAGETAQTEGPGKSGNSVGHRAKAEIAAATTDQPLPSNITGKVASALARGLPVDSLLALQTSPDAVVDDAGTDAVPDPAPLDTAITDGDAVITDLSGSTVQAQTTEPSAGS